MIPSSELIINSDGSIFHLHIRPSQLADRIILVATHVVSDVETVATEVILLRAGQIIDAAPVPDLIAKYAPGQGLEDVYLAVFGEGDGK